jgi:phosphoglucomutase
MSIHPLAGKPAPIESLTNIPRLISAYYTQHPEPGNPARRLLLAPQATAAAR